MLKVVDAAVEKAYKGERKISRDGNFTPEKKSITRFTAVMLASR